MTKATDLQDAINFATTLVQEEGEASALTYALAILNELMDKRYVVWNTYTRDELEKQVGHKLTSNQIMQIQSKMFDYDPTETMNI